MRVFEYYNDILCVVAEVLYRDLNLLTYEAYLHKCKRGRLNRVRNACPGQKALINYSLLPDDWQAAIKEKYGDPHKIVKYAAFEDQILTDVAAEVYYRDYTYNGDTHLSIPKQKEYKANAEILTTAHKLANDRRAFCRSLGGKAVKVWERLSEAIDGLDKIKYPHSLPSNPRSLQRLSSRFQNIKYYALIHKGFGNDNSEKINDSAKLWVLSRWADRVKRVANLQQLFMEYNAKAVEMGWKKLEDPTALHVYLHGEDVQGLWWGHRYGELKAKEKFNYQHSTRMPTMRDSLWYSDGTKLNYYYQKDDGSVGTALVYEIMDAYSEVLLGYCISDAEDYKTQYSAFKMAAQFAGHRPYQIGFDNQGGHKKLIAGSFLSKVAHLAIKTQPYNGKSKTIESAFNRFQSQFLKRDWFFTGQNIQAKKEESKANMEMINANKHNLPTLAKIKEVYKQRRDEWNASDHHTIDKCKFTMYQESFNELTPKIEMWDMVEIFWMLREEPVAYNAYGLTFVDKKQKYTFMVYNESGLPNIEWHSKNIDKKFWIKYDPEDMSMIYLYDRDSKGELRFVTEARTKIEVARGKQEQEAFETDYIAKVKKMNDEARVERMDKMEQILAAHNATAEDYGLNTPRILGIKNKKKQKAPANFGEVLKKESEAVRIPSPGNDEDFDIYKNM
jgi:hypothetical protein